MPSWTPYRYGFNNPIKYIDPDGRIEFESYDAYKAHQKENGLEILSADEIGSQGHWLTSDRKGSTSVWDEANEFNIQNNNTGQYEPYEQVLDLYKWVQEKSSDLGQDVRWMDGAIDLVGNLKMGRDFGFDNILGKDMVAKLEELNIAIANAALPFFDDLLYCGNIYKGKDAYNWDYRFISYEQGVVAAPIYIGMNKNTLNRFNEMVRGKDSNRFSPFYQGGLINPVNFGKYGKNVWDIEARIDIPMHMLYGNKHKVE